jgi:hypothetical protein
MRYIAFLITLTVLAFLAGCSKSGGGASTTDKPVEPPHKIGARLKLTSTTSEATPASLAASGPLMARAAPTADGAPVDFDLGQIGYTTSYQFLLENIGDEPATNLQITASVPGVVIWPSALGVLSPAGAGGVRPIVTITLTHGKKADGVTETSLLPAGELPFVVSISSNETFSSVSMQARVLVASYELIDQRGWVELPTRIYGDNPAIAGIVGEASRVVFDAHSRSDVRQTFDQTAFPFDQYELIAPYGSVPAPWVEGVYTLTNTGNCPLSVTVGRDCMAGRPDVNGALGVNPAMYRVADEVITLVVQPGESTVIPAQAFRSEDTLSRKKVDMYSCFELSAEACFSDQVEFGPRRQGYQLVSLYDAVMWFLSAG